MFGRFVGILATRPPTEVFLAAILWIMSLVGVEAFDRQVARSADGAGKLDLIWGYDTATVLDLLGRYGEVGRDFYRASTFADMIFPLALAIFALLLLPRAGLRSPVWLLLPVGFLVLDLVENGLLLELVASFPNVSDPVVRAASVTTRLKLSLLAPTYLMMVASLGILSARFGRSLFWPNLERARDLTTAGGPRAQTIALAAVGLVLALRLTPIQAAIWNQAETPGWIVALSWPEWVGRFSIPDAYAIFGKLFVCVPLAAIGTLEALRRGEPNLVANPWIRILLGLLALSVVADIGTYWVAGIEDPALRFYTFWCGEVPIWMGIAAMGCALGFSGASKDAGWNIWVLRLLPLTMATGAAVFEYMPHGLVLPFAGSLFVIAVQRARSDAFNSRSRYPRRPPPPQRVAADSRRPRESGQRRS